MKKHERVLRYLREYGRSSYKSICDAVFKSDESAFHESLSYLKSNGLISVRETDQRTLHTCFATLTDKGAAHRVSNKVELSNKWKSVMWHAVTAVVSAVITLLITKILS